MRRNPSILNAASILLFSIVAGGVSLAPRILAQDQAGTGLVQVSSVDLIGGAGTGFRFVVHLDRQRDHTVFWVNGGRTAVVDVREAYTPYRGRAVGPIPASAVVVVRASQFLDREFPIARFELDLAGEFAASSRWVGPDLEITFQPGSPGFRGTASTSEVARAVEDSSERTVVVPPTGETDPSVPAGTRVNPFDPLLKPPEGVNNANLLERLLPDAETLTLTGIVYREDLTNASVATLRDGNGLNYRLRQGDRVKYGFLRVISRTEVVFELDKYGRRFEHRISIRPSVR